MDKRYIDLSQPWFNGMPHYPGMEVQFRTIHEPLLLESGPSTASLTSIHMTAHVGTHVDAARHMITGAPTIDQYPLQRFVGPAVVLDVRRDRPVGITAADLKAAAPRIRKGDSVLLYMGWADRFRDPSFMVFPYLMPDAADYLLERGINLLGTDTPSPDMPPALAPPDSRAPIHSRLLGHDILIIETLGMGLKQVLGKRITLVAAPLRIEGCEGSPIAAVALLEE